MSLVAEKMHYDCIRYYAAPAMYYKQFGRVLILILIFLVLCIKLDYVLTQVILSFENPTQQVKSWNGYIFPSLVPCAEISVYNISVSGERRESKNWPPA